MSKPNMSDMITSFEDVRFFHEKLDAIVRGPEQLQDLRSHPARFSRVFALLESVRILFVKLRA